MWIDDLDFVESCDFYCSLLNFDSIDSINANATTNTFAYVKAPKNQVILRLSHERTDERVAQYSVFVCSRPKWSD